MAQCPNCQKHIGDCRMPTTCHCSSCDLRARIRDLQARLNDMMRAANALDSLEQNRSNKDGP